MSDPFLPIIQHYEAGTWWTHNGGRFRDYLLKHNLPLTETAAAISVDFRERLAASLHAASAMVLRLGNGRFAVVGTPNRLDDFFLHDEAIFGSAVAETHFLDVDSDTLTAYSLLPRTERTLVNLAFASGLMRPALSLDMQPAAAPATGSSTYPFRFRPHTMLPDALEYNGQVEIDAVFVARRAGVRHLFVVEAKVGDENRTLAKHKLLYPVLALSRRLNEAIPIVPVYMRVVPGFGSIQYHIAECESLHSFGESTALDQIQVKSARTLTIQDYD